MDKPNNKWIKDWKIIIILMISLAVSCFSVPEQDSKNDEKQTLVKRLLFQAQTLFLDKKYDEAQKKIDTLFSIDESNFQALELRLKIHKALKKAAREKIKLPNDPTVYWSWNIVLSIDNWDKKISLKSSLISE